MPKVHLPDGRIVNFPDGMSEQDITKAVDDLSSHGGQAAQPAEKPPADLGRYGGYKMIGDAVIGAAKSAWKHPIETGALIGGAAAVPLTGGLSALPAIAAAGLGGAGGAGLGMIANAVGGQEASPTTAGGVVKRMGTEGATQAASELGGRAIQGALKGVATQMYRGALRPPARLAGKYPNVVQQGIDDALIVGPTSSVGQAKGLMKESRAAADTLRSSAQSAGAGAVPRAELRKPLMQMARDAQEATRLTGVADDAPAIVDRARRLQPSYPLDEAHEAGRILNDRADAAFRMEQRGGTPRGVEANVDQALARAFSGAVKDRVPGMAAQNALTSSRFGLSKALEAAANRPHVLGNLMAGTAGVGTYFGTGDKEQALMASLAMKGLSSPRALSTGAIGLSRMAKAPVANLFRTALLASLGQQDE